MPIGKIKRTLIILALGFFALSLGCTAFGWALWSQVTHRSAPPPPPLSQTHPPPEPDPAEPKGASSSEPQSASAQSASSAQNNPSAPNQALRSDRPRPDRIADGFPSPPPEQDSSGDWDQRREQAAEHWWTQTEAALERHAQSQGWPPADHQAVREILQQMQRSLAITREAMTQGEATPREGREQMATTREAAALAIQERLGEEQTQALQRALQAEVMGGGF